MPNAAANGTRPAPRAPTTASTTAAANPATHTQRRLDATIKSTDADSSSVSAQVRTAPAPQRAATR